ncbi:hypothetical protein NL676_010726 [Syzygium grande]|nr:hypothetical protein NL676_010726 [Syzygium grande]
MKLDLALAVRELLKGVDFHARSRRRRRPLSSLQVCLCRFYLLFLSVRPLMKSRTADSRPKYKRRDIS